jgi:hypothetical protein
MLPSEIVEKLCKDLGWEIEVELALIKWLMDNGYIIVKVKS